MISDKLSVNTKSLVYWFNAIRNVPDNKKHRVLDAFWAGQIDSKCWLVNALNEYNTKEANIYIFGGWVGVLSSLLFTSATYPISKIYSIDIDDECEKIAYDINHIHGQKFTAITDDMAKFNYDWDYYPNIVINTSTEHINQETYDEWYDKIPKDCLIVLQGNNFFDYDEHIRCSSSLLDFKRMNYAQNLKYESILHNELYDRYMCIFKK